MGKQVAGVTTCSPDPWLEVLPGLPESSQSENSSQLLHSAFPGYLYMVWPPLSSNRCSLLPHLGPMTSKSAIPTQFEMSPELAVDSPLKQQNKSLDHPPRP